MPVQGSMQSLTAVVASNSPSGTDSISNTLDDYLRSHAGILRYTEARAASLTATNSMSLAAATGAYIHVLGGASATTAVTIAHLGTVDAGIERTLVLTGYSTLVPSANLILPGSATIATSPSDVAQVRSEGSGAWRCIAYQPYQAPAGYALASITAYTSGSGSFDVPKGVRALYIECVGGGGGGGGVNGIASSYVMASGGGGGAYCASFLTTLAASYSYEVGTGGSGGAAGANDGSDGGDTTFNGGGTTLTAGGGKKGFGCTGSTGLSSASGAAGGDASGGDVNLSGGMSNFVRHEGTVAYSVSWGGAGGGPLGGGMKRYVTDSAGNAGNEYGGGGGGAGSLDASNYAGGDGADGIIRIWVYR